MQAPTISIGMAHFDDFHGLYFSIQSLRLHHPEIMRGAELVVIDNSPHTEHGRVVKSFVTGLASGTELRGVKYVTHEANTGTSATRNMVFEQASGEAVVCMDCHVLFPPGALQALLDYYTAHPKTRNILSGPLVYDGLQHITTHFNDEWRGEMWGTWGAAWRCGCGPDGLALSFVDVGNKTQARYMTGGTDVPQACDVCGKRVPVVEWARHEQTLERMGFKRVGMDPTEEPFEIPGQGLGVFSMRRDAWPGFNKDARGFGGEELYIHGKVRAAGGRAMCIPAFRWLHRFARPDGVRYPLTLHNKVRNYVLEFQEMGWDLTPIREHFSSFPQDKWEALVADPVGTVDEPAQVVIASGHMPASGCPACNKQQPKIDNIETAYEQIRNTQRDLNEHMPKLRELASMVDHVTEFSGRQDSTIAFLAADPVKLVSYQTEHRKVLPQVEDAHTVEHIVQPLQSSAVPQIAQTDLLFLDTRHTYDTLRQELETYGDNVRRFIVLHDTHIYGEFGEDGGPGLMVAVADWLEMHPEWSIIHHTVEQYGLTVLGCQAQDKPQLPGTLTMAKNFAKALAAHMATGAANAPKELVEARLQTCTLCSQRVDDRCAACGCNLPAKASFESSVCPLGLWPATVDDPIVAPPMQGGGND